ncbi:bifunctional ADP-dependent NAD(P)H-hydrate dehydratase/NAD(P)H-hydrate epimerase [Desulfuribacillus alkaliarsenatis]|uniref:Bifunctional NAD(P)H-hydrate repair enzyme n=1 Tax=Desulfuribacillus alkaliarsenatis TaxID=766136 RepID=A0A1E5FZ72_9FIRM|nr:bifunctional ADP-dependent NAD(P)H-hydrate dehydratase/NAD(P)H-hydrate epimerase [Desulfuribacillus alkaliarsenatis]OEF95875.1 hypothetical protein BHF68_10800 [Desulfuribacillus alkaliarsenatis]
MFVVTNREMREIDRYTIEEVGIPSLVLMENAGKAAADWIQAQYSNKRQVGVVCGKGNNGGDGLVIARHLINHGFTVKVYVLGEADELSPDAKTQYYVANKIGLAVECISSTGDPYESIRLDECEIIVDALLGTGSRGSLGTLYGQVVQMINARKMLDEEVEVISIDNPTGVFGNNGEVASETINANVTLTLGYIKQSLITYPAADYAGKVIVLDIGIPKMIEQQYAFNKQVLTEKLIYPWIPKRVSNSHKGTYGKVRCIAGSSKYFGAGLLSATASLHIGAGLVFWDAPEQIAPMWQGQTPELIFTSHPSQQGCFASESLQSLIEVSKTADAIVVGCGIDQFPWGEEWVEQLVNEIECPMVIDADAIILLRNRFSNLKSKRNIIVTPHPGEFAKVLGISVEEVEKNRADICLDFAKEHQVTLVLKGCHTTIATPDGRLYFNTTASHVLAKGGSGDVLAGFIGGLLAQGISTEQATCVAVYCHGRVAKQLAETNYVSTMASDVSRNVGAILQTIANRA